MKLSLQSFVDVITNSSTSIYTLYDEWGIDRLKSAINEILKVVNPSLTCDDLVNIELVPSAEFLDALEDDPQSFGLFDEDSDIKNDLLNFPDKLDDAITLFNEEWYDNYAWGYDLEITPTKPEYEPLVNAITNIINPFEQDALFG